MQVIDKGTQTGNKIIHHILVRDVSNRIKVETKKKQEKSNSIINSEERCERE